MGNQHVKTILFLLTVAVFAMPIAVRAASKPDRHGMQVRLAACAACHGKRGQGKLGLKGGVYPRLAGQPAGYLYAQMLRFKARKRSGIPPVAIMQRLLTQLPDAYLHRIASYYNAVSPPYPSRSPVKLADLGEGRSLVRRGLPQSGIDSCTRCHGDNLLGRPPDVPALAGQYALYLKNQFAHWVQGERNNALHKRIAEALSPAQTRSLVAYLASLRPGVDDQPTDDNKTASKPADRKR